MKYENLQQQKYLTSLGLSEDESNIFLLILSKPDWNISEIIREIELPRGKVEKNIESLMNKGLVERNEENKSFKAKSLESLKTLLEKEKKNINTIKTDFTLLADEISKSAYESDSSTKVIYYEGMEGLQQVMWNSSKTMDILRLFEIEEMSVYLNFGFYEEVRKKYVENNIESRELTNEKAPSGWTDNGDYVKNWETRYLDPAKVKMKYEMMIYNDVYALYYADEKGISCVEIYNPKLAQFQKQLFDYMWKFAKKMKIVNEKGAVVLVE